MLNVEYSGATCPHVTILFGDTKDDVGLGLVKEGLVMVDVRKEKHLQKMVSEDKYIATQAEIFSPVTCISVPSKEVCLLEAFGSQCCEMHSTDRYVTCAIAVLTSH